MTTDNIEGHLNLPERIHDTLPTGIIVFDSDARVNPKYSRIIEKAPAFIKKECVTYPNFKWETIGDTKFSILDLSGKCNCGKLYEEHPEYVIENQKRIENIAARVAQKGAGINENAK